VRRDFANSTTASSPIIFSRQSTPANRCGEWKSFARIAQEKSELANCVLISAEAFGLHEFRTYLP